MKTANHPRPHHDVKLVVGNAEYGTFVPVGWFDSIMSIPADAE